MSKARGGANAANEITGISEQSGQLQWADPTYDKAGNATFTPMPGDESNGLNCTFDAWNRLVHVTDGDAVDVSYEYDGLHRKIVRTDNTIAGGSEATLKASTTDFYYAGQQVLEERQRSPLPLGEGQGEGWADGASYHVIQYVWPAGYIDSPVLRDRTVYTYSETEEDWTSDTDRCYYLTDANHNVTALTDDSGAVVERYSYSAYGAATIHNADWTATRGVSAVGNTRMFAGMERDPFRANQFFIIPMNCRSLRGR